MTVYQQPDPPAAAKDGDVWVQTETPTLWERWLIRRGRLPEWWGSLPPEEIKKLEARQGA